MSSGPIDLASLSPAEKRALLAQLLEEQTTAAATYPLSDGQRALWFLHQFAPDSPAYNIMYAARLQGPLALDALEQAWQALVDRHAALRTTYALAAGQPVQNVHSGQDVDLKVVDATAWSAAAVQAELEAEADRPFDLEFGPLLRLRLYRRSEAAHVLLLAVHHIAVDFWSLNLLLEELGSLYTAALAGKPARLPELPRQYTDFVRWQQGEMDGPVGERLWAYWRQQLAGKLSPLDLPTDRPRPPMQSFRGATYQFDLDPALVLGVRQLARRERATPFATLLAAFQALLYRYSGQADIVVGTPTAGRPRAELERVVGYFVNPVVIRSELSADLSFAALLGRTRATVLAALQHQDYPLSRIVDRLQPARDPSRSPLFQVAFVWDKARQAGSAGGAAAAMAGLQVEHLRAEQRGAPFDLTLTIFEVGDSLGGAWQYNEELFAAATIARMASHFERLLHGAVSEPDRPLSHLPLLLAGEREQQLVRWNETRTDYGAEERTLSLRFQEQAARSPDNVAVLYQDESLSYAELNRRANQLAHALQALGVGPDVAVALCLERSPAQLVALLGILKAGGAYVPLSPDHPRERLAFLLQDTAVPVLLTQASLLEKLPEYGGERICLDDDWPLIATQPATNPVSAAGPDHLAYVLYTSGSTGQPKGVMVPHRGLTNYLAWAGRAYSVDGGRGSIVHSPITFDLTITGLFPPLLAGKSVLLLPESRDIQALAAALRAQEDLSLLKITPAHLEVLGQTLPPAEAAGRVRVLVIGGEALGAESIAFWRRHALETRLINEYGPTEAVVGCCVYEVAGGESLEGSVPIGRPIANVQLYVLDGRLEPLPLGVPGELLIGGEGLARGYLGQPALTAERFIPHPFSRQPGARLYRTGDLARYRADGTLEYLGRRDDQVKIQGYRIELGEIEWALGSHPQVEETAVVAVTETRAGATEPGRRRLVAYVVPAGQPGSPEPATPLNSSELRRHLQQILPEYMIPATFVTIAALPLNANGKVDRRALPEPGDGRPELARGYVAPGNETERLLAELWAEVIGVDRVGIHDNFFELGGASIQSLEVATRAGARGLEMAPEMIFRYQTVAELAIACGPEAGSVPAPDQAAGMASGRATSASPAEPGE